MFTMKIPSINAASVRLMVIENSFSVSVVFLMMLNTQILPIENEIPIRMNHIFKNQNSVRKGMLKLQTAQINNEKANER